MKAKTELNGLELREAYKLRSSLLHAPMQPKASAPGVEQQGVAPQTTIEGASIPENAEASPDITVQALPSEPGTEVETSADGIPLTEAPTEIQETRAEPDSVLSATQEAVPPTQGPQHQEPSSTKPANDEKTPVNVEQRLAEIEQRKREAFAKREEARQKKLDAIKGPFAESLKERFSWTEEKIEYVHQALEILDPRKLHLLRKVRLLSLDKPDEKIPPRDAKVIGELVFIADYLPPLPRDIKRDKKFEGRNKKNNKRRRKFNNHKRSDGMQAGDKQGQPGGKSGQADDKNRRPRKPFRKPNGPKVERKPNFPAPPNKSN